MPSFKYLILFAFVGGAALANTPKSLNDLAISYTTAKYLQKRAAPSTTSFEGLLHKISAATSPETIRCQNPYPSSGKCVEAACERLDSYECDDINEIQQIASVCRGNFDGGCLRESCNHLDSYECDDINEIEQVAQACRGVWGNGCIKASCDRMDSYDCDDINEIQQVASVCQGVDGSCVEAICSRLDSYECDDINEIAEVARACKGEN